MYSQDNLHPWERWGSLWWGYPRSLSQPGSLGPRSSHGGWKDALSTTHNQGPWACTVAASQRRLWCPHPSSYFPGAESWASAHHILLRFVCTQPFNAGNPSPPQVRAVTVFFDRIFREKKHVQFLDTKSSIANSLPLLRNVLCLPGTDTHFLTGLHLEQWTTAAVSYFHLFLLQKKAVLWWQCQSLQALKRFPRSLPWVSWFAEIVSVRLIVPA